MSGRGSCHRRVQAGAGGSGLSLEFGDLGIAELFLLSLKWHLEQSHHLKIFE
jgi:hypothetical protein